MPTHPIDKLESLIPALVEEAQRIQKENERLNGELTSLQKKVDGLSRDSQSQKKKLERIQQAEEECKRLTADRKQVRKKVNGLLQKLERIKME